MVTVLVCIIALLFAGPAYGSEWFTWERSNTYLHIPLTLVMTVDMAQSLEIASRQVTKCVHYIDGVCVETRDVYKHYESNPILGEHPEEHEVITYFITSYAVTTALV